MTFLRAAALPPVLTPLVGLILSAISFSYMYIASYHGRTLLHIRATVHVHHHGNCTIFCGSKSSKVIIVQSFRTLLVTKRERERKTDRERERKTDRQTERVREREKEKERERQR